MPCLADIDEEKFARLVASGLSQSEAYRRTYPGKVKANTVWSNASTLHSKVSQRVVELRATMEAAGEDKEWVASKTELMQYLTRAVRTPLADINEDSDLCQESTTTTGERGDTVKLKAVPKLAAVSQLAAMAGYVSQAPQQLHLHNHTTSNLTINSDSALAELMGELLELPEPLVVEMAATAEPAKAKRGRKAL